MVRISAFGLSNNKMAVVSAAQVSWLGPSVGGRLSLFCIHHMNWVNCCGVLSIINIVIVAIIINIIIIIVSIINDITQS